MRRKILLGVSVLFLFSALTGGCGSSNKGTPATVATVLDNAVCTNCHATTLDTVTGKNIVSEWNGSPHAIGPQLVACQDCHGPGSLHWGVGPIPFPNPDAAGVCSVECHRNSPAADLQPSAAHFPNLTPAIQASPVIWDNMSTAAYVSSQSTNKCRNCHNPHDNTLSNHGDWAASAHAATKDAPWIHYDFKSRDVCNRCHTTTGYVKYLTTGDTKAWASANSSDKTKEVLRCDGCHQDYSWKRRTAQNAPGGVQLPYGTYSSVLPSPAVGVLPFDKLANNGTSTVVVDAGDSDLCINCHSGTNSGKGIGTAPASILTGSFAAVNSHYFGAAGTLYALNGYEYQTHESYFKPIVASPPYPNPNGSPGFEHYQIGVGAAYTGATRGPCVGCHMYPANLPQNANSSPVNGSHGLRPVTQTPSGSGPRGIIGGTITGFPAFNPVCGTCHTAGFNPDDAPDIALGGAADINTLKAQYASRLAALEAALNTKGIYYNPDVYPYFFDASGNQFTAWPNKGTLGAAFNLNMLTREPGGYVHNHWYTALLIYDSLDFLDDGQLNGSYTNSTIFPTGRALSGPLY